MHEPENQFQYCLVKDHLHMSIFNRKTTGQAKARPSKGSPHRVFGLWRSFRNNEDGVTAVEFSLIAIPFFLLIVALLETALVHMTSLDLDNAVKNASRKIRTGQAQAANKTAADFKELICAGTSLIDSCKTNPNLVVDVRTYQDFSNLQTTPSDLYDSNTNQFNNQQQFVMGGGGQVVVVRTYYKMPLLSQITTIGLANAGPHHRMIDAVAVFRNEPF